MYNQMSSTYSLRVISDHDAPVLSSRTTFPILPMPNTVTGAQSLMRQGTSLMSFFKAVWDPLLIIIILNISCAIAGETFDGPEIILALLSFSLTFPSSIQFAESPKRLLREILTSWGAVVTLLGALGYGTGYLDAFDRDAIIGWVAAVPAALFISHLALPTLLPRLLAIEGARSAVIVGANEAGQRLARQFRDHRYLGVEFAGYFEDRGIDRLKNVSKDDIIGPVRDLANYARTHRPDAIFIALPMASQPRILKLLDDLRDSTASIYFLPDIFMYDLIQARIDEIRGIPVVAVCESPFYGVNGIIKRISDIVLATVILLLIAPIMAGIALAVKMTSPGPVLFKQRRYGLDGQEIIVYKFRSMTVCEDGAVIKQAQKNDQRITPLGAILRKTSLDELPQFINVLQGRMSVVGPRPHAVAHNEMYRKIIKGYMVRHKVKPGITGLAQVCGYRGETETIDKMEKRVEHDLEYLRRWSLRLDLQIIFRTVWLVIKDHKAY